VTYYTKAGGGCGQCHPKIEALIETGEKGNGERSPPPSGEEEMTNIQKIRMIEETLGREIIRL